jgi:hypothetical protein
MTPDPARRVLEDRGETSPSSGRSWSVTTTSVRSSSAASARCAPVVAPVEVALRVEHQAVEADVGRQVDELQRDRGREHGDQAPAVGRRRHLAVRHGAGDVAVRVRGAAVWRSCGQSAPHRVRRWPPAPAGRAGPPAAATPSGHRHGQHRAERDDAEVEQVHAVGGGEAEQHRPDQAVLPGITSTASTATAAAARDRGASVRCGMTR